MRLEKESDRVGGVSIFLNLEIDVVVCHPL